MNSSSISLIFILLIVHLTSISAAEVYNNGDGENHQSINGYTPNYSDKGEDHQSRNGYTPNYSDNKGDDHQSSNGNTPPNYSDNKGDDHQSSNGYTPPNYSDDKLKISVPKNEIMGSEDWPSPSYYHGRCPNNLNVEQIINRKLREWVDKDYTIAPSILRLHFHDCVVRGCDASILLNHDGSERMADVSKTLRGFEVIDDIKAELEKACPKIVSCADILTAAARDATVLLGGEYWTVPYGRKDGRVSIAKEADIVPRGHENITTLLEMFQSMGLDVTDLVILSGAHTIGRSSCREVQERIYNYKGTGKPNDSIDKRYLNYLQRKCRWASEYVELDQETPRQFDTMYYKNLVNNMGLLSTDQLLLLDSRTKPIAKALATMPPSLYGHLFGASMTKLGNVGVLTGQDEGEIRTNCNSVNSYNY